MRAVFLTIISLLLASGCAPKVSNSNLYWGDYSSTLYKVKKEPGQESDREHESELLSIVQKSKELNLRVPPGVYAELGLYANKKGDKNTAKNYFRLEQDTYPEGKILMEQSLQKKLTKS